MKALLLTLLLVVSAVASSQQNPVYEQVATNNQGQPFIRIFNTLPRYVSCYYSDDYNYFTFVIAPNTVTVWNPIYGTYIWECV